MLQKAILPFKLHNTVIIQYYNSQFHIFLNIDNQAPENNHSN